jgi:hypothetical protein
MGHHGSPFIFGRIFCSSMRRKAALLCRKKPGYPLVSFLPSAKKDTAPIPCAFQGEAFFPAMRSKQKTYDSVRLS